MSLHREPESVVARLRRHGRALLWPIIVLLVDSAAVAYLLGVLDSGWRVGAAFAGGLLLLLLVLLPVSRWLGGVYTITTRRVVIRSGLVVRHRQEVLYTRIYNVALRQSAVQQLFRSGDILLNVGLDRATEMRDVPSGRLVQAAIQDLMEANSELVATRTHRDEKDVATELAPPSH